MEKQEILSAFIQAERDWSKPIEKSQENHTWSGLCLYFSWEIGYNKAQIDEIRMLWQKHKTRQGTYDFYAYGKKPTGRAERLDAIRKVINDLQKES